MSKYIHQLEMTLVLAACVSLPTGCGGLKSASTPPATVNPQLATGMSPQERAKFCFVQTDRDSNQAQTAFLQELAGTWIYVPHAAPAGSPDRIEFALDTGREDAAITKYYSLYKDPEDVQYKKACVSKPLDASHGAYAGYRIIEFMASNNDGAVAMLAKYEPAAAATDDDQTPMPVLYLSNYDYVQHTDGDALSTIADVIAASTDITVYRAHR